MYRYGVHYIRVWMDIYRHACIYVMHVCVWIWDDACEYVCMYVCIFLLISFVGVYFWGMAWGMHVCMLVMCGTRDGLGSYYTWRRLAMVSGDAVPFIPTS